MEPEDAKRFLPSKIRLKDGTEVAVHLLSSGDGEILGDFYEGIPLEDARFFCPHRLDREHAEKNAANASSPTEVFFVLEMPDHSIGGITYYRWQDASSVKSSFGLCVSRKLQGKGAGKMLTKYLLNIAVNIGPAVMGLTVQCANTKAVALYRQLGFEVVREQMRGANIYEFPPEPEYYMEKRIRQ